MFIVFYLYVCIRLSTLLRGPGVTLGPILRRMRTRAGRELVSDERNPMRDARVVECRRAMADKWSRSAEANVR